MKEDQQKVNHERKQLTYENHRDLTALESYLKERKEIEASLSSELLPRYERVRKARGGIAVAAARNEVCEICQVRDRKSTRLNSSHANISYAVFCLKKKNIKQA